MPVAVKPLIQRIGERVAERKETANRHVYHPSCYLLAEHGKKGGSQDEEHGLEFEAICCNGVNILGQESFDLTACGFRWFPGGGQQVAQSPRVWAF